MKNGTLEIQYTMQKFIVKLPCIAKLLQELYATFVTSYFFFRIGHFAICSELSAD